MTTPTLTLRELAESARLNGQGEGVQAEAWAWMAKQLAGHVARLDSHTPIPELGEAAVDTLATSGETSRVLADILVERKRQIVLGWTREHDDRHTIDDIVRLAERQARKDGPSRPAGYFSRQRLVEAAALLVAAVELMDRLEEAGR